MTYRESARDLAAHQPLRFHRSGLLVRCLGVLLGLGMAAFLWGLTPLVAVRSSLRCERGPDPARPPVCVVDERYPFGVREQTRLPPLRDARVASSGRATALLLDDVEGGTHSFLGVGASGSRAIEVAAGVRAFLEGPSRGGVWELRAGSRVVAVLLAFAGLAGLAFVPAALRTTVVSFDPRERRVDVRRRSGLGREIVRSLPLDLVGSAVACGQHPRVGTAFTVCIVEADSGRELADLDLAFHLPSSAERVAVDLNAALARWRTT